eukprot:476216-Alexandrium_andersonii.AAC.1
MGYIHRAVFAQLDRTPLVLCQGCIAERLDSLKVAEGVSDPTALQIRSLLLSECPRRASSNLRWCY